MTNESSVRLCLGCKHIDYNEGSSWQSDCSGGHDNSSFSCKKRLWAQDLGWMQGSEYSELENHLLLANTCPDFTERKP